MKITNIFLSSALLFTLSAFCSATLPSLKVMTSDNKEIEITPDELQYFKTLETMVTEIESLPPAEKPEMAKIKVTEKQLNYFKKLIRDVNEAERTINLKISERSKKVVLQVSEKNRLNVKLLSSYMKAADYLEFKGLAQYSFLDIVATLYSQEGFDTEKNKIESSSRDILTDLAKVYLLMFDENVKFNTIKLDKRKINFSFKTAYDFGKIILERVAFTPGKAEYKLKMKEKVHIFDLNGLNNLPEAPYIVEIYLEYQDLTELHRNEFIKLKSLKKLTLGNNLIAKLDLGCFNGLEKLKDLNLSGNKLTSFDPELLKPLVALTDFYIGYNPFPEDKKREIMLAINSARPTLRFSI